jgi:hypothetical protein
MTTRYQYLKWVLFGKYKTKTILAGPARGIKMNLMLAGEMRIWLGLFEPSLHRAFRSALKKAPVCYDIGASVGYYSLLFARSPSVREVHSFESDPGVEVLFNQNARMNESFSQKIKYHTLEVGEGSASLDYLVETQKFSFPDVVKIDAEGAETCILKASSKLIEAKKTVWFVEAHTPQKLSEVMQIFNSHGYHVERPSNPWWFQFFRETRPRETSFVIAWPTK